MTTRMAQLMEKVVSYNPINEEVQEVLSETNEIEGDYQEQLRPVNERIQSLTEIQAAIQKQGMSRGIAERIRTITGNDTLLEENGLSLESFTTFPSRNGVQASLELAEDHKNILIGAAIALGVGIIIKLIMVIWKFFSKRKTADADRKAQQEKVAKTAEALIKAEQDFQNARKEFSSEFHEIEQGDDYRNIHLPMEKSYTLLIKEMVQGEGESVVAAEKVLKNIQAYESGAQKCLESAEYINGHIEELSKTEGGAESIIEQHVKPAMAHMPPADMKANLEKIQEAITNLNTWKNSRIDLTTDEIKHIVEVVAKNRELYFFEKLKGYSPFRSGALANTNYEDRAERALHGLKKRLEESDKGDYKLSPEVSKELRAFTNYYKENMQAFLKVVAFYVTLSGQWEQFMSSIKRYMNSQSKIYKSFMAKLTAAGKAEYEKYKHLKEFVEIMGKGWD